MPIINVKAPPTGYTAALGDGVQNDQPALQKMIDDKLGALYFPPGRYRINTTLRLVQRTGHHLIGCGMAPPVPFGAGLQGTESVIIWGGPDDGTMIEYNGVGLVWSGLSLWGCALAGSSSSCPPARAKHGIKLSRPTAQFGTGKIWFDSILIAHCKEGIATTDTPNNDTLAFGYYWCEDCDYALRLGGEQSLQYTFQTVRAVDVGTIFRVDQPEDNNQRGGGRIFTENVIVESSDTTVLDVKSGSHNSAFFQIGGVVIKESASDTMLLSNDAVKGGPHDFRFTNAHFRNNVLINVRRAVGGLNVTFTTLEIVGCRGVGELEGNVTLTGRTNSNRVVFFVRDSDLSGMTNTNIGTLIHSSSTKYRAWGIDNWTFDAGKVTDSDVEDP